MEKIELIENLQNERSINLGSSYLKSFAIITLFVLVFLALVSGVSAKNFNSTSDINDIQTFLSNTSETDNKLVLDGGEYNSLSNLNVSRSINISSNGHVNIRGTGGTLFNITSRDVIIINLNVSGYTTAIKSNTGGLSVTGCNITTTDMSIELTGSSLTDISLENNTIISFINTSDYYGAVHMNATIGSIVSVTLKGNNIIVNSANNSDYGVCFDIVGCDNTLNFINNNITGNWAGIILFAWSSNNTITIRNNNVTGNWFSVEIYGNYSDNNILITNNNITATARDGVFIYAGNSNNTVTVTNNNIKSITRYGLYLYTLNSNNTITVRDNNITGTWIGVYMYAYRSNNTVLSFIGNNITGSKYAMYIYSYRSFSGLSLLNNTFKSDDVGLHFILDGAVLSDIFVKGNNILVINKGIGFEESNPSFVNLTVNYNRILADIGLDFTTNDNGSNFDYNWWGVNNITGKTIDFVTSNHYILNITNLTSLDNFQIGSKVSFALLVSNTTLTNEGVLNLPYFNIIGTFNGMFYDSSRDDLFVHQFTILNEGIQVLDASLDDNYVDFTFNSFKQNISSTIILKDVKNDKTSNASDIRADKAVKFPLTKENNNITNNNSNNNLTTSAAMKKTGIPIISILLTLLLIVFGFNIRKIHQ